MVDPDRFIFKDKPTIYTGSLIILYNWRNRGQVHELYGIIELEKMCALITKNLYNLGIYRIIKILLVLCSTHIRSKDQNKFMVYVNNYINWDQFNQLYDSD